MSSLRGLKIKKRMKFYYVTNCKKRNIPKRKNFTDGKNRNV